MASAAPSGPVERPPAELSPSDRDPSVAVAPGGLVAQCRHPQRWGGVRATVGVRSGRARFELTVADDGLCRVGWSTRAASLELGTDAFGVGFGGTGKRVHDGAYDNYGRPFKRGDVIGCLVDHGSSHGGTGQPHVRFYVNGDDLGESPLPAGLVGRALYPHVCLKNCEASVAMGAPGGASALKHAADAPGVDGASADDTVRGDAPAELGGKRRPLALLIEPTRDLAEQTHVALSALASHLCAPSLRLVLLVGGGKDARAADKAVDEGVVDIVTGTPPRVLDLVKRGRLDLSGVRVFVLDEADALLQGDGFRDDCLALWRACPQGGTGQDRLQTLLFSATLHAPTVREAAELLAPRGTWVDLKGPDSVPQDVDHVCIWADPASDRSWLQTEPRVWTDGCHAPDASCSPLPPTDATSRAQLSEAAKRLKPRLLARIADAWKMDRCLVFCRTNHDCDLLERFFLGLGGNDPNAPNRSVGRESGPQSAYACAVLGGARSTEERRRNLDAFRSGGIRFLICTDAAARGIDVPNLPFVVNLALPDPDQADEYVHRAGRVGRAGLSGLCVSILSRVDERVWFCRKKGYKPWLKPTDDDVKEHTVWRSEAACLKAVQERLEKGGRGAGAVATVGDDLEAPPAVANRINKGEYGQPRGEAAEQASAELAARLAAVRPAAARLAAMEVEAQLAFFGGRSVAFGLRGE